MIKKYRLKTIPFFLPLDKNDFDIHFALFNANGIILSTAENGIFHFNTYITANKKHFTGFIKKFQSKNLCFKQRMSAEEFEIIK